MRNKLILIGLGLTITIVVSWIIWRFYNPPETNQNTVWHDKGEASEVKKDVKETIEGPKTLKVVNKSVAIKRLELPNDVVVDDKKQITATTDVPKSPYGAKAVSIIDTETGDSKIIVKPNPKPAFQFLNSGAVGVKYGMEFGGSQQLVVYARQDIIRVLDVTLGVTAEVRRSISKDNTEFAGYIDASYRW